MKCLKKAKIKEKRKKYISCCEDKSLVVMRDIVIIMSYFVEKVFLNFIFLNAFLFVQRFSSFGKLFQTDRAKNEIQC